jgi:hypothetical protein
MNNYKAGQVYDYNYWESVVITSVTEDYVYCECTDSRHGVTYSARFKSDSSQDDWLTLINSPIIPIED